VWRATEALFCLLLIHLHHVRGRPYEALDRRHFLLHVWPGHRTSLSGLTILITIRCCSTPPCLFL
jgi:hypothetical protein